MSLFTIIDEFGTEIEFDSDEATDGGNPLPFYGIQVGTELSAGGQIKQQIRPGRRLIKKYAITIDEDKYIAFYNMLANLSRDYYIRYTNEICILINNSEIETTNNFKIGMNISNIKQTAGSPARWFFDMTIQSVNLL